LIRDGEVRVYKPGDWSSPYVLSAGPAGWTRLRERQMDKDLDGERLMHDVVRVDDAQALKKTVVATTKTP